MNQWYEELFRNYGAKYDKENWLLKSLNFKTIDIFRAKLGAFTRNAKLTTEDFEMLVIAEK